MSERKHPLHESAEALIESESFCDWLDANHGQAWPHNPTTARRFICQQCGVQELAGIGRKPVAAAEYRLLLAKIDAGVA